MRFLKYMLTPVLILFAVTAVAQDASVVRGTRVDGTVTINGGPLKEGDIILTLGAGDIYKAGPIILEALRRA